MAKTSLLGVLALLIIVQAPFIFAIECNQLNPEIKNTCLEILNSDLTLQEKETLISNLEYNGKFFPDHDYIYQNNVNLEIKNPPKEIQTKDSTYIKNAWMDLTCHH